MLLLVMRGQSHPWPPPEARRAAGKVRDYTAELLAAALFLSGWCVLRLLVSRDTSGGVDAALAVSCLVVGIGTVAHCLRALHDGQRKSRAERTRARAAKREMRTAKRRARAQHRPRA
ncbi:MAG: hypothetical protein WDO69_13800 [Pseudomonadota bacterium]